MEAPAKKIEYTPAMQEKLTEFLVKELKPISSAKPDVLASYVIALLKKGEPASLEPELTEFLKTSTLPFLEKLDSFIKTISPSPLSVSTERGLTPAQSSELYDSDEDDERNFKHRSRRRRSSPDEYDEDRSKRRHREKDQRERERERTSDRRETRIPKENRVSRVPIPPVAPGRNPSGRVSGKQRCRDYDEKGYCLKGDDCPFSHGTDPITVPDVEGLRKLKEQGFNIPNLNAEGGGPQPVQRFSAIPPGNQQPAPIPVWQPQGSAPVFRQHIPQPHMPPQNLLTQMPPMQNNRFMPPNLGSLLQPAPYIPPLGMGMNMALNNMNPHQNNMMLGMGLPIPNERNGGGFPQMIPPIFPTENATIDKSGYFRTLPKDESLDISHMQKAQPEIQKPEGINRGFQSNRGRNTNRGGHGGGQTQNAAFLEKCQIGVGNMPVEYINIAKLNEYFSKFGTITNMDLLPKEKKAFITFSSHGEAQAAVRCPDAVFGNRFIKVFWKRDEQQVDNTLEQTEQNKDTISENPPSKAIEKPSEPATSSQTLKEVAEVKKKIEIKQKAKQLQQQQQELLNKQLERQKELLNLVEKTTNKQHKSILMKELNALTKTIEASISKKKTATLQEIEKKTPQLKRKAGIRKSNDMAEKEKLDRELEQITKMKALSENNASAATEVESSVAKLEQVKQDLVKKAEQLGIDVQQVSGRGRGAFAAASRARGSRGRGRGRGGTRLTLDNRPKNLYLSSLSGTLPEELTQLFVPLGATGVQIEGDGAVANFEERHAAEAALKIFQQKYPSVSIGWVKAERTAASNPAVETKLAEASEVREETAAELDGAVHVYEKEGYPSEEDEEEDDDDERRWKR